MNLSDIRLSSSSSSSLSSLLSNSTCGDEDSIVIMDDCFEQMHNDEFEDDAYFKDLCEQYVNFAEEENINREKLARQLNDCRDEQHQHFLNNRNKKPWPKGRSLIIGDSLLSGIYESKMGK